VTTKDLEDSMERMAKLIADQLNGSSDGHRQIPVGQPRPGDGASPGDPLGPQR